MRIRLRAKLLITMLLIISASIGLMASQAILLFQEDKSSYVFSLNASRAIKISEEVQVNVQHLTEKMRIFADVIQLPTSSEKARKEVMISMLRQYPEFLLFSIQEGEKKYRNVFLSRNLTDLGLTVGQVHQAYREEDLPFGEVTANAPLITRLELSSEIPTFTLAVRGSELADSGPGKILVAEFLLDRLYATHGESSLFDIYLTDASGHPMVSFVEGKPLELTFGPQSGRKAFSDLLPRSVPTAGTREYDDAGVPMLAAYSPVGKLNMWTVVQIPKAKAFEAAQRLVQRSLVTAGVVGVVALALVILFASSMTKSLEVLTRATREIAKGNFAVKIPLTGGGEIRALAERFQKMIEELGWREGALKEATKSLMRSEKMTALGALGAGIAHEVKNPMTSIRGYAQMGLRKLDSKHPVYEYFRTIEKETGRSLDILKNLLRFSRQETSDLELIDLNPVIDDAMKLVSHQLEMKGVKVVAHLHKETLRVKGNANQLEQVLLNLLMNAGDAMEDGGIITLTTDVVGGKLARIRVADTGCGMPEEVAGRIFDPFFTTKPVGKGTGLGLSVSYGIIKEHHGEIAVKSVKGEGTTFTIQIPIVEAEGELPPPKKVDESKRVRVVNLR